MPKWTQVKLFTAEGNYVRLSWDKVHPLLGRPLSSLEPRLDSKRFFRANRQQIINLEYIESVDLWSEWATARATAWRPRGADLATAGTTLSPTGHHLTCQPLKVLDSQHESARAQDSSGIRRP